jgi:hypothetical protein
MGVLLAMVAGGLPAYASTFSFTASEKIPISVTVPVPCANGGAGELVDLSGSLNDVFHVTIDNNFGTHVTTHDNPQGVRGTGETTGAARQLPGRGKKAVSPSPAAASRPPGQTPTPT